MSLTWKTAGRALQLLVLCVSLVIGAPASTEPITDTIVLVLSATRQAGDSEAPSQPAPRRAGIRFDAWPTRSKPRALPAIEPKAPAYLMNCALLC